MKKSILACLAALALLSAAPGAALAKGGGDESVREKVVARLKKAQAENRRVEVHLKYGLSLRGRVGELRERGFTFEPDNKADVAALKELGLVAAVLYDDVDSVRYPSKVRKFFKGVGIGFTIAGMTVAFLPTYAVLAMLGELPSC